MKDYRQIEGLIRQMTECLENAYNRGYKQGFDDGHEKGMIDGVMNIDVNEVSYVKGLNDAWECARKIDEDRDIENYVFGEDLEHGFSHIKASEAIYKIQKYEVEKHRSEIRVGDEVYSETYGEKGVVTKVWDNSDIIILSSNSSMIRTPKNKVKKTGKHYDEMEQLLEKMRGE